MSGDLISLNVVFITLYGVLKKQFQEGALIHLLPLVLVLLNLCYLICKFQSDCTLPKRNVRTEQIVWRVVRGFFIFAILFICISVFCSFDCLSTRFFFSLFFSYAACLVGYRLFTRNLIEKLREQNKIIHGWKRNKRSGSVYPTIFQYAIINL